MRIKQPLLSIFLLVSLHATAQEKFIEVTVSDTAWVKPNQFVYTIITNPSIQYDVSDTTVGGDFGNYEKRKGEATRRQKLLMDSFKHVLANKGFDVMPERIEDVYSTYDEPKFYALHILTQSFDSVKLLYHYIVNNQSFYGGITFAKATNESIYNKRLLQKLLIKAKDDANAIAAESNLRTGNIISIKEGVSEKTTGEWVAYPPLSGLARDGYFFTLSPESFAGAKKDTTDLYKIEKTLVVRFAAQ
jgi:hypothetical protein